MRVACEYCGTMIDIKIDDVCPNCGAAFHQNDHMQILRQEEKEREQLRKEQAQLQMEQQRLQNDRTRLENEDKRRAMIRKSNFPWVKFYIITVICIIIGVAIIISTSLSAAQDDSYTPIITEPVIVETPVTVSYGETASTSTYSVVCDKVEEYYYPWEKPAEGFKYVGVHFIVTNISDREILSDEPIQCTYIEGNYSMQAEKPTIRSEDLHTKLDKAYISPGNSIMGKIYFTVPVDADLVVTYGDYVTINIPSTVCVNLPSE